MLLQYYWKTKLIALFLSPPPAVAVFLLAKGLHH